MFLFCTIFVFIATLEVFYNFVWKRRNLPPGPTPWPIVGNVMALKKNPPGYEVFKNYAKEFGHVYTFWVGEKPVIVVTDYGLIHKTFIMDADAYSGRNLFNEGLQALPSGDFGYGVVNTEGTMWQESRRFMLQALRTVGMGRNEGEKKILLESELLIDHLKKSIESGQEIHDLVPLLDIAVGSVINNISFGFRYETDEHRKHYYKLKSIIEKQVILFGTTLGQMVMGNPWLRYLPFFKQTFETIDANSRSINDYIDEQIHKRLQENANGLPETPNDFMDVFFIELEKYKSKNDVKNLPQLFDSTLGYIILYLLLDQAVQRKMQKEIDALTEGNQRQITMEDRSKLPYINAVINECQRLCNLVPHNLAHKTTKNVEIAGHKIKAGAIIVPQISSVLYDEQIFPEPYKFKPERFLDEDKLKKVDEFIPFSIGKRICVGESLARMELFLIIANLFNVFNLYPEDPLNPPSIIKKLSFVVHAQPFLCRVEKRKE